MNQKSAMKKLSDDKIRMKKSRDGKSYTAPTLRQYGEMKNLTAGGVSGVAEGNAWNNRTRRS